VVDLIPTKEEWHQALIDRHGETILEDGDSLEVVSFVGGG
jgi:sulfur carrier protein ThiS